MCRKGPGQLATSCMIAFGRAKSCVFLVIRQNYRCFHLFIFFVSTLSTFLIFDVFYFSPFLISISQRFSFSHPLLVFVFFSSFHLCLISTLSVSRFRSFSTSIFSRISIFLDFSIFSCFQIFHLPSFRFSKFLVISSFPIFSILLISHFSILFPPFQSFHLPLIFHSQSRYLIFSFSFYLIPIPPIPSPTFLRFLIKLLHFKEFLLRNLPTALTLCVTRSYWPKKIKKIPVSLTHPFHHRRCLTKSVSFYLPVLSASTPSRRPGYNINHHSPKQTHVQYSTVSFHARFICAGKKGH